MRLIGPLSAALLILLAGCTTPTSTGDPDTDDGVPASPGPTQGPMWSFVDTDGVTHSRDTASGGPVLLFFMATWCLSCRGHADDVAAVHQEYKADGLKVFSLGWDTQEKKSDLEDWKERYDQDWPHGVDQGRSVTKTFGVTRQSSFVILDPAGIVVEKYDYPGASRAQLRDAVQEAFGPQAV